MWILRVRKIKLTPFSLKAHGQTCYNTSSYAHVQIQSIIVRSRYKHITTGLDGANTIWPEKIGKVWRHENEATRKVHEGWRCLLHRQSSDLIPLCKSHAYFREERRGKNRKTETFVCHQTPLGRLGFFGVPERCSDQTACVTMTPQRCRAYSATVQEQRLGCSLVFDMIFSIFYLTVMGNVWKHALCVFKTLGAWLNPPHRWLCVKRRLLPQTPTDGGRRRENGNGVWAKSLNWLPDSSGLELSQCKIVKRDQFFIQHMCQCHFDTRHPLFVHFVWVYTCCVTVFTCCHPNAHHFVKEDLKREREQNIERDETGERVKLWGIKMIT